MSLITEKSIQQIPGILTASLSNISSVVQALSALQVVNPAAFGQFQSQISFLLSGFDAASNLLNSVGGFAQGLQDLAATELSPSSIQQLAENVNNVAAQVDNVNTLMNTPGRGVLSNRTSVQSSTTSSQTSMFKYPNNLGKYWFGFSFSPYYFSTKFGAMGKGYPVVSKPPSSVILMPVPSNLSDKLSVAFSEFKPGNEALAALKAGLGAGAEQLLGPKATIPKISGAIPAAIASTISSSLGTLAKITVASAGVAINPATTLLLEGPQLKDHVFEWRVSPSSEAESKTINNIIKKIKYEMSPALGLAGILLNYPSIINCYMFNAEKMYFFKPAMVTGFNVDYTPSGPAFFKSPADDTKGGYPVELRISMQIKELEAWLREDFTGL